MENPTPFFLNLLATSPLLPVHRTTRAVADSSWMRPGRMIGNGAFRLTYWQLNDRIRLERNEHYWGRERVSLRSIDPRLGLVLRRTLGSTLASSTSCASFAMPSGPTLGGALGE